MRASLLQQQKLFLRSFGRFSSSAIASFRPQSTEQNPLVDKFGRFHSYLRISLTERCHYCMPEEGVELQANDKLLTADEVIRISKVFASQGVDKVRLTGGEPTIRKDLIEIIRRLRDEAGIREIGMTSNGIVLARKLNALIESGLNRLNISLDTLREDKYMLITRRNGYRQVMRLNCVVIRGVNEDEVIDFVRFTQDRNVDVRFIEYMPFGGNKFQTKKMVSYKEMLKSISTEFENQIVRLSDKPNDTSKAYKVSGFKGQFGFITSMSEHFCATCNRLRVTADGNLKVCLHGNAEISLRDRIRQNASDSDLLELLQYRDLAVSHRRFSSTALFSSKDSQLTHVDSNGRATMVDVGKKVPTVRIALAVSTIHITDQIMDQVLANRLKKGDVRVVAQIAGIMGAKQTSNLIPLCHNIPLADLQIRMSINEKMTRPKIRVLFARNPPDAFDNCNTFPTMQPYMQCPFPGWCVEIIKQLADYLNYDIEPVIANTRVGELNWGMYDPKTGLWDGALGFLSNGSVDTLCLFYQRTTSRVQHFDYSYPIMNVSYE
ncbi:Elp3 domain-containing protein [Aphelenchoides besseyi]|nr:Elp3 domain-containing protein [Aphelenchoides besseyi]